MKYWNPLFTVVFFIFLLILGIVARNIKSRIEQLSYQNRLLKALRSLDIAVLSTVDVEQLCQAVVDVIHKELGFSFAVIALVDDKLKGIKRMAISHDPFVDETLKRILPVEFKEQIVPFSDTRNLFTQVVNKKKNFFTDNLYDIQVGVLPIEISKKIQEIFHLKGVFLYPLVTKDKVIGVLEYPIIIDKKKLSIFEYTIMDEFTTEVSRALENAILYENLKSTTQQLEKANLKLKELDRLKDDFVSVASHELRTPMTAIKSYLWMAINKGDQKLTEKMAKYLSRSLSSTDRLINLVNDMLNVSRIESGSIEVTPIPLDMVVLANEVVDEIRPRADEKGLKLFILESRIPQVFADPEKMHQVLLNLVGNSLKFTPAGGNITISFFTDGQVVETSIKDTGVGIAKEDLGRLFQKFGRLDNSFVAIGTAGGTGLGLYISKRLVDIMQGKIWVSSDGLGKGSTFTFSLPVASQERIEQAEKYHIKPIGESKGLAPVAI